MIMNFIQKGSVAQVLGGSMIAALLFMAAPMLVNAQENLGYFDLGGGNDFQPYYNDYQPYANDFQPYANDFQPYTNDFQPYANDFQPYANDFQPYYSESPVYYGSDGVRYSAGQGYQPSVSSYPVSIGRPTSYYQPPAQTQRPEPRSTNPTLSYSIVPIGQPISIENEVTSVNENINENANLNENTVTSTNTNTNTSSSNSSVTSSGNSTNNINVVVNVPQQAPITPIYQMPIIQYPVQYVYPQQQQAPYCTLTIQNNYSNNNYNNYGSNQATLTWTSSFATSAYISPNIGTVNTSGSRLVTPGSNQIYTMTVYGQSGQSANCQANYYYTPTYVQPTYIPPTTPAPYVSLSQIPYTGFDFGPLGNAIYWMTLLGFALAAAYLVVYYQGGAIALATELVRGRRSYVTSEMEEEKVTPIPTPVVDAPVFTKPVQTAPALFNLPVAEHENVTNDSMDFYMSEDGGAPRIIITRN